MKKLFLVFAFLCSTVSFAQQEIKIDITDALALKTLDISYEYYVSDQSSIGLAALFNFEGKGSDFRYNEDRMITPYFRHYFTTEAKWNFFGEGWFGINFGEKEVNTSGTISYEEYTDGALGISIGTKYTSIGGLVIDIHGGLGRNMFGSDSPVIVPRIGVGVGYSF
ncbi:MAG: DUF3575 domain-containing protein [Flavobacteriaceae bacterium]